MVLFKHGRGRGSITHGAWSGQEMEKKEITLPTEKDPGILLWPRDFTHK